MRATPASFQPCPTMPRRHPTLIPALRAALLQVPLAAMALFALPAHADHAATTDTAPRQDQATAMAVAFATLARTATRRGRSGVPDNVWALPSS